MRLLLCSSVKWITEYCSEVLVEGVHTCILLVIGQGM